MDPNVSLQATRLRECLIIFLANIWFHPSMDPNMFLQVNRVAECFVTFLAGIRFLLSMNPNAFYQGIQAPCLPSLCKK